MPYDVVIIGAGPAGLAAAIYAARKSLRTLLVGSLVGGQVATSGEVGNYLGFSLLNGVDLVDQFRKHLESYDGIELMEGERVTEIKRPKEGGFRVLLEGGKEVQAKSIIVATGQRPRKLNVPGEAEFANKGVSYCSTCDGPLFSGKDVVVVGGGNSGLEAAIQLSTTAKNVYIVQNMDQLTGDDILQQRVRAASNVTVLLGAMIKEIRGEKLVKSVLVLEPSGERELTAQGVFIEIGMVPSADFLGDLVARNDQGEIIIDKQNQSSVPGIFACGDVTDVHDKQIIIAAGEGAKAALSTFQYLIKQ